MPIMERKKLQLERDLASARGLLEKAESRGIDVHPIEGSLEAADRSIGSGAFREAGDMITDAILRIENELELHDKALSRKERELQDARGALRRIDEDIARLTEQGIEIRIELFEEVRKSLEAGSGIPVLPALERIERMFTRPIYQPEMAWDHTCRDPITHLVTLRDMVIYSTPNRSLVALDRHGEQMWRVRTEEDITSLGVFGNRVMGATCKGLVLCLDLFGNQFWGYSAGGAVTLMAQYNDLILAASEDRNLYCLDAKGNLFWKRRLGGPINSVAVLHDRVLAGSSDQRLHCIEHNGKPLWRMKTEGAVTSVLPFGDLFLALTDSHHLYCADPEGNHEWKIHVPEGITAVAPHGDRVFLGIAGGRVRILDHGGKTLRNVEVRGTPGPLLSCMDLVFAGNGEKYLSCITREGDVLWTRYAGNPVIDLLAIDKHLLVLNPKRIRAYATSVVPVFLAIERQIREGKAKFTNIYEAEQVFDMAKAAFSGLDDEKAGRLLTRGTDILLEHRKRVRRLEREMNIHKPEYAMFDRILESEYRDRVVQGIGSARKTISEIQAILATLVGKRANLESILMTQKADEAITSLMADYREKLLRAKDRNRTSVARSYAFMVVNLRRKLQLKEKMGTILVGIDDQIRELSDFSRDLFENAREMPRDADLVGAFGILNSEAVQAIDDANRLIGEIAEMETELNEFAIEKELGVGRDRVEIEELQADVRAEIEKELE